MAEGIGEELAKAIAAIEDQARRRYVRWDEALWREVLGGPAAELAATNDVALVTSYLQLAAEGIGLGYLVPAASGVENFFTLAWRKLIPRLLGAVPDPQRRVELLAMAWNLGENLEGQAAWLRRLFHRRCRDLAALEELPALVSGIAGLALGEPEQRLAEKARTLWIPLAAEDRRFLPGAMHFLAPTVVCVHDRLRSDPNGDPVTQGVWLGDEPLALGPMGCRDAVEVATAPLPVTVDEVFAACRNDWRAAVALVTSQHLVALLP
jgi:hypothetical protein